MTDARCPVDERRLFFRVTEAGEIEVACRTCRDTARRKNPHVVLVLHRYSATGYFVATQELELIPKT